MSGGGFSPSGVRVVVVAGGEVLAAEGLRCLLLKLLPSAFSRVYGGPSAVFDIVVIDTVASLQSLLSSSSSPATAASAVVSFVPLPAMKCFAVSPGMSRADVDAFLPLLAKDLAGVLRTRASQSALSASLLPPSVAAGSESAASVLTVAPCGGKSLGVDKGTSGSGPGDSDSTPDRASGCDGGFASGQAPGSDLLTPREKEVLRLIARGLSNKLIADKLCIGLQTVITHRKHICQKLEIRTAPALAVYALMNGLV